MKKRFSEEKIIGFPREAERGPSIGKSIKAGNYKIAGGTEAFCTCPPGRSRKSACGTEGATSVPTSQII